MDFFRNDDELMPVWNHDDEYANNNHNNFENFWSMPSTTSDEDNSASSDAMFVDSGSQEMNFNEYSSSESFSASTEDFPQQQLNYQQQVADQQAQQQYQLEQHQLHIQHQLQLQQLQLQQQQQHLQYQAQYVPMTYQYVPQQQYYAVDPSYLQTPNVNTEELQQQQQAPVEYYQQPQQQSNLSSSTENYEDDFQYDNAYEEDDDQYDPQYEEKSTASYGTPASPSSEISQAAFVGNMDVDADPVDFKLPASKTPIMEAMVVCALNGWGLTVVKSYANEVVFRVTDFDRYYRVSRAICSKHRPTEDVGSRVKTLRRWFVNFPKKKDRQDTPSFLLSVKPNTCKKVHGIIERNVKLMTGSKRSSR